YESSLKTSPLLYPELCHILFEKCFASGSIRRPIAEKRHSSQNFGFKLVEIEDDVNNLNKEGGSSAASEHVNLDAGYDSSFKDGSSKEPNIGRGRRKKKVKKDSKLDELEETMKNAITNIAAQENQGPTMEEYHEKLKSMRLEYDDPVYLAAT
nr:myb/SANT-like domain, Harbinger transposase-derived nuclease domain protein [Tanacetum cinerariifolium]